MLDSGFHLSFKFCINFALQRLLVILALFFDFQQMVRDLFVVLLRGLKILLFRFVIPIGLVLDLLG